MVRNIIWYLLGIGTSALAFFFIKDRGRHKNNYYVLNRDYEIGNAGFLKKGTMIKFDHGMAEGFDRYVLYLNLKGGNLVKDSLNEYDIVPYWLIDTL